QPPDLRAPGLHQAQPQAAAMAVHALQRGREAAHRYRVEHRDAQPRRRARAALAQFLAGERHLLEDDARTREQALARVRERHAARGAHEECRAELVLEPRDGRGQRGLRGEGELGATGEAAAVGNGDEVADLLQVHERLTPGTRLGRVVQRPLSTSDATALASARVCEAASAEARERATSRATSGLDSTSRTPAARARAL